MSKVLLIEDDQIMRENTAEILELAQYEVLTAADGKEGVKIAQESLPDIILCDIMMPGLDGYGVLHILSKNPLTEKIPFIFLTAKSEKSDFRKGMSLGADDYLTKPFDEHDLLSAIEMRFKKQAQSQLPHRDDQPVLDVEKFRDPEYLSAHFATKHYKKKSLLFEAGDESQFIYFIKKGKLKLKRTHSDGKDFILDILGAGHYVGESDFFLEKNYNYSAICIEDCEIIKIRRDELLPLARGDSSICHQFIQTLSKSIKDSEEKLISLAYDTARKRVANALVAIHESTAHSVISMTREDLANYVGVAFETLIRCLSDFKDCEYIKISGREIEILDLKGLSELRH